jgi:hypothetical protein
MGNENNRAGRLRPEARPVAWLWLDESQQAAFKKVASFLADAVERIDRAASMRERTVRWLSDRWNQTVFLSGGRGTGKTTVLTSLVQTSMEVREAQNLSRELGENEAQVLRKRVVWLEPLDLEPLPSSLNILAAILARLEDATQEFLGNTSVETPRKAPGLLDVGSGFQAAMTKLQRLHTRIAFAWDGNLDQRAGQLDLDTYAVEVKRTEHARLRLNHEMSETLEELAKTCFSSRTAYSPLFVLPIDDFDLNPQLAVTLLRILRMISVPRLFALVLGDIRVAEELFKIKFAAEFDKAGATSRQLPVDDLHLKIVVNQVAANALRKLLPTHQRIALTGMMLPEALKFRPLGELDAALLIRLLTRIQIAIPVSAPQTTVSNLFQFLFPDAVEKLITEIEENERRPKEPGSVRSTDDFPDPQKKQRELLDQISRGAYAGLALFAESTPRHLSDVWLLLEELAIQDEERTADVSDFMVDYALSRIGEDTSLPIDLRERLRQGGFRRQSDGHWEPVDLPLVLAPAPTAERKIEEISASSDDPSTRGWLWLRDIRSWKFSVVAEGQNRLQYPLGDALGAALMIAHDLIMLRSGSHSNTLPPSFLQQELCFRQVFESSAGVQWGDNPSMRIPWPGPLCSSLWRWDRFLKLWSTWIPPETRKLTMTDAEMIAYGWLNSGTEIAGGGPPSPQVNRQNFSPLNKTAWENLGKRVEGLVASSSEEAQRWLHNLSLLMMPESGMVFLTNRKIWSDRVRLWWEGEGRPQAIKQDRMLRLRRLESKKELVEQLRKGEPVGCVSYGNAGVFTPEMNDIFPEKETELMERQQRQMLLSSE